MIIIVEPEIGLGDHTMVPDLAGWKKERFPVEEDHNWISAAPDWVCEVLSPKTLRIDKVKKMPIYAHYGVGHIWLIDPTALSMDVFRLEAGGGWLLLAALPKTTRCGPSPSKRSKSTFRTYGSEACSRQLLSHKMMTDWPGSRRGSGAFCRQPFREGDTEAMAWSGRTPKPERPAFQNRDERMGKDSVFRSMNPRKSQAFSQSQKTRPGGRSVGEAVRFKSGLRSFSLCLTL